ncbi:hypothetical protein BpHYR1_032418 [Brachionus plicatilis]|uniref:Uncharacterized protein n=1 Tax=Brachionus plicatilis TaxID=10195 RepID=A0A3M7T2P9_BRAPC|nr:hypothetical protein BpHYR1_032418 [Brachionus plicatilis]
MQKQSDRHYIKIVWQASNSLIICLPIFTVTHILHDQNLYYFPYCLQQNGFSIIYFYFKLKIYRFEIIYKI